MDSIRQAPDPCTRSRGTGAVACRRSDPRRRRWGANAAAHASVGQLVGPPGCRPGPLAGVQVRVLPGVLVHLEGPADGRRRQPFRKRKALTGMRVRSSLPPRCSVGPAGVDARLSSGRSRVQVPYGARRRGGCWLPTRTFNPGRTGSIPVHGAERPRPHEVVAACRILSPVARVQVPVGVQMLSWRNWQTPRIQGPVSSDVWVRLPPRAQAHPPAGTGRRTALRTRCPSGREGSTPSVGTTGRGQVSRLALHAGPLGFDTPSLHQPVRRRIRARG